MAQFYEDDRSGATRSAWIATALVLGLGPIGTASSAERLADRVAGAGLRLDGTQNNGRLGSGLAGGGDFNGDGRPDLAIGAPSSSIVQGGAVLGAAGEVFVLYGPLTGGPVDLEALRSINGGTGEQGLVIQAEAAGDLLGQSLTFVDDANGDGYDDLLIGASGANRSLVGDEGAAYLVFGGPRDSAELDLRSLRVAAGANAQGGVIILGNQPFGQLGARVAAAGDLNGDGRPDLLLGNQLPAPGNTGLVGISEPISALAYGRSPSEPWPALVDLLALQNGQIEPGIITRIIGEEGSFLGRDVAGVGDFDGDGRPDALLGASSFGDDMAGEALLIPGRSADQPFDIDLDLRLAIGERDQVRRLFTGLEQEMFGDRVAGIGDFNGDGRPDLAVGTQFSPRFGEEAGVVFVLFGRNGAPAEINLSNLLPENGGNGRFGLVVAGRPGDRLGASIAGVGDLDGDGLSELLIGAPELTADGVEGGGVVIVRGQTQPPALIRLEDLIDDDGNVGQVLTGGEDLGRAGRTVAAAGDANDDGSSDFLVGADLEDAGAMNSGRVYVGFGSGMDLARFNGARTAAYYEPQAPGQGVLVSVGSLDGQPALFATWYTYLDGEQQWFAAGPQPFDAGSRRVETALLRTRGASFGDAFDPGSVTFETWGTVTLDLGDCDRIDWRYSSQDGSESGALALQPLLADQLGLTGCRSSQPSTATFGTRPAHELAGAWWNPDRAGEGVVVDIEDRGGQPTAFVSWFTYDLGDQLWLVGSAPVSADGTVVADLDLIVTGGTGFGADFDPAAVQSSVFGQAELRFVDCNNAELDYRRSDGGEGSEGTLSLVRFTDPAADRSCLDP